MFDFSELKKFLQERNGTTDVAKAVSISPSYCSGFDQELNNTELILKPKEKTSTMSDEEIQFIDLCQKLLRKLGFIKTTYDFSEQFMGKSQHYLSMLLSEGRKPSIDALHNLVKNIAVLNDNPTTSSKYLDDLIEQGNKLLTKRLLKYF